MRLPVRFISARFRRFATAAVVAALLAGCRDDLTPTAVIDPPASLREHVTGAAAQSINAQGYFEFTKPAAPSTVPILGPDHAAELAKAYVRTWRDFIRGPLEKDRGGPIPFDQLQPGRVFFAQTPFGVVPDGFHPTYRNIYGPYYLVTMVHGREPVLIISVAAYATYEQIDERGYLKPTVRGGGEFDHSAIALRPRVGTGFQPNFPEQAVERIGRASGARASHVPELVRRADPVRPGDSRARFWAPAQSLWRLRLDREIEVTSTIPGGRRSRVQELFVGAFDQLLIPAETQLSVQRHEARLLGDSLTIGGAGFLEIPILRPIAYDIVEIGSPGRQP
jgi:hypothetical protein